MSEELPDPWRTVPAALGGVAGRGRLRASPGDFVVEEELGFAPAGAGEHLLLKLRETGCNTDWVAGQLARWGGRPRVDVSYAGLKDRHAVTTQWFSVRFPGGRHPDPATIGIPGVELLDWSPHDRKLKRGALRGNRFSIRVTDLVADPEILEARLGAVARRGVPNAFGPQRFGRDLGNLRLAAEWFGGGRAPGRQERGFALSAARAFLFNMTLAERVNGGDWERAGPGDPVQLDGRGSWFLAEADDTGLAARLESLDVHPTGALWGRGDPPGTGPGGVLERAVAARFPLYAQGLESAGLEQERRALRLRVAGLQWVVEPGTLELTFSLPAGAFATAVLREIADCD